MVRGFYGQVKVKENTERKSGIYKKLNNLMKKVIVSLNMHILLH